MAEYQLEAVFRRETMHHGLVDLGYPVIVGWVTAMRMRVQPSAGSLRSLLRSEAAHLAAIPLCLHHFCPALATAADPFSPHALFILVAPHLPQLQIPFPHTLSSSSLRRI